MMLEKWDNSAWVEAYRERVGFGVQIFPIDTKVEPGRQLLAAAQLAEDLGFDAFFVADHPGWALDGWLHLAAVAVTTSRIRLGTLVNCVGFRHPLMMARFAADLDHLSQGRFILGLGIGWDANEFAKLGLPFPPVSERQAALEEAITLIRGVWGTEPFSFQGRYFQTTDAQVAPPPVQQPGPPLLLAGGGERVTLRQVAQYADACNLAGFGAGLISAAAAPDEVRRKLAVLRRHCEALGRPYETILRTYAPGWLILSPDEARLQTKLQHYFPEGLSQRYTGPWANFVLATTPQQAISCFQALADAGIQYFVPEILDAADEETILLLAEQVVPHIRPG